MFTPIETFQEKHHLHNSLGHEISIGVQRLGYSLRHLIKNRVESTIYVLIALNFAEPAVGRVKLKR